LSSLRDSLRVHDRQVLSWHATCKSVVCLTSPVTGNYLRQSQQTFSPKHPQFLFSLGGIASCSASNSACFCTFLRSVVCLSVVCHIRAPCLTVRRIKMPFERYACEVQWHIVLDGVPDYPSGKRDLRVKLPVKTSNCKLQLNRQSYAATWRVQTKICVDSNSEFCQITLVLVLLLSNEMSGEFSNSSWTNIELTGFVR